MILRVIYNSSWYQEIPYNLISYVHYEIILRHFKRNECTGSIYLLKFYCYCHFDRLLSWQNVFIITRYFSSEPLKKCVSNSSDVSNTQDLMGFCPFGTLARNKYAWNGMNKSQVSICHQKYASSFMYRDCYPYSTTIMMICVQVI